MNKRRASRQAKRKKEKKNLLARLFLDDKDKRTNNFFL
jgi:hypothetical protein